MSELSRRDLLKVLAAVPVAGGIVWMPPEVEAAWQRAQTLRERRAEGEVGLPSFFTPGEQEAIRVLVDLILPADDRSGSASEAGVPEFIDVMVLEDATLQVQMRGGLAWLDRAFRERFGRPFVACEAHEHTEILDRIAWPARAKPEHSQGVAFFNRMRDLTAAGFFSSRMGVADLEFSGNRAVRVWTGCPQAVTDHLGVDYHAWDDRYGEEENG